MRCNYCDNLATERHDSNCPYLNMGYKEENYYDENEWQAEDPEEKYWKQCQTWNERDSDYGEDW